MAPWAMRAEGVPLKAVLDHGGRPARLRGQVGPFNGMDDETDQRQTPDSQGDRTSNHAPRRRGHAGYAMERAGSAVLKRLPLRIVVPGYYGTYWVKHLNEITVVDDVSTGISGLKSSLSHSGQRRRCVPPGTAAGPKGDDPDQPLDVARHHQRDRTREAELKRTARRCSKACIRRRAATGITEARLVFYRRGARPGPLRRSARTRCK